MITVTKKDLITLGYGASFAADIIREAKKLMISICCVGLRSASVRAKHVPLAHSAVNRRSHRYASFLRLAG